MGPQVLNADAHCMAEVDRHHQLLEEGPACTVRTVIARGCSANHWYGCIQIIIWVQRRSSVLDVP